MTKPEQFSEAYYMDGIRSGLSNYENFHYLGEPTETMARRFIQYLKIEQPDTVLDYGCARGYFVKALYRLGIDAWGKDLSTWAVENADSEIAHRCTNDLKIKHRGYDWIMAKDVLEHVPVHHLAEVLAGLIFGCRKGMLIIVPLTAISGGKYLREEDEKDVTHEVRWTLESWHKLIHAIASDFIVTGSYHIPDLKPASLKVNFSCAFFTLLRHK